MHTKGEWVVYYGVKKCQVFPKDSKLNSAKDALSAVFDREGEGMANAKLIAAAPDLLYAVKQCAKMLADKYPDGAELMNCLSAINKATG